LESALKIHRLQYEYNLLMGECKLQTEAYKDAVQYFSTAVRVRPKNIAGWEALIRSLYFGEFFTEARQQALAALQHTNNKPLFLFYLSAVLFALNKPKEAVLYLWQGMEVAPKLVKKFVALDPSLLQNPKVVDVIAQFKRKR
jgi:cytochrome c-type biogenesis protein CcmH/NrfG